MDVNNAEIILSLSFLCSFASLYHTIFGSLAYENWLQTMQLKKYYQPRKSHRNVTVNIQGLKVPLYGAGASLVVDDTNGGVPVTLVFEVRSRGSVVGKLVRTKHRRRISCSMDVDSRKTKTITLKASSCTYK